METMDITESSGVVGSFHIAGWYRREGGGSRRSRLDPQIFTESS